VSPRPRKQPPQRVGGLVARVLGDLGLDASARVVRLSERWEEAVGREVASHCRPTAIAGDELEVTADSSPWCHAVSLQSVAILAALRRVAGSDAPSSLRLRVGGTGKDG
jgi:predicted nucleic acid-binding Zn ribbon protein